MLDECDSMCLISYLVQNEAGDFLRFDTFRIADLNPYDCVVTYQWSDPGASLVMITWVFCGVTEL